MKKESKKEKVFYRYISKKDLNSYELENKRLSYYNLFYKDENLLLCNNIINDYDNIELVYGNDYDEDDDYYYDIYQYYLIDEETAKRLGEVGEIIYYHNELDLYVLGVTHFGTSWTYVLTDIILENDESDGIFSCYYYKEVENDNN